MSLPYVVSQAIWNAKEASETVILKSDFERCQVTIIEIATTGFSGTLDIQGKVHELGSYANVPYIRQDQATVQTPSVTQISYTLDTGTYRYVVLGYWRRLQLVMTRTAGSIICGAAGSSDAKVFPSMLTIEANSGSIKTAVEAINTALQTGGISQLQYAAMVTALQTLDNIVSGSEAQVDVVAALPAGSNLIGKVSEPATVETPFTATTGNIVVATHKIAPAAAFKLTEIELHLASAPTGANPNLVITLDDGVDAAYDLVILTLDLVANAVTDLVIKPNKVCKSTDVITAAWTNTNNITWAIKFKHQLV